MQIYAVNGSPRKKGNTAEILKNVLEGAAESRTDALTESLDLYDLNYKGCVECFECKRIGGPSYGKCAVKDELRPYLGNILQADAIVFGSPVFFGNVSGMLRSFFERFAFPLFKYDKNYSSLAPKKLRTAFVYTMNIKENQMEQLKYRERLGVLESFCERVFGHKPRVLYVTDTWQFSDYSKYESSLFSVEDKKRQRENQFPIDCKNARDMGAALAADVAGEPESLFGDK